MALTSETYIDKVEILEDGQIQVRKAKVVKEDGVEITRQYHREVLDPGHDDMASVAAKCGQDVVKNISPEAIVSSIWTEKVVNERKAKLEEIRASHEPSPPKAPVEPNAPVEPVLPEPEDIVR